MCLASNTGIVAQFCRVHSETGHVEADFDTGAIDQTRFCNETVVAKFEHNTFAEFFEEALCGAACAILFIVPNRYCSHWIAHLISQPRAIPLLY